MTAATTGLARQQQARPAFLTARQSMAGMAAAGRRRSAGSLKAVHCSARSRVMAISLARAASRSPGPLFPGRRAEGPLWNRLTAVPDRPQLQTRGSDDRGVCSPASRPMSRCRTLMTPRRQPGRGCAAWARPSPASSPGPRPAAIRARSASMRVAAVGRNLRSRCRRGSVLVAVFGRPARWRGPTWQPATALARRPVSAPGACCGTALGIFGRAQFRRCGRLAAERPEAAGPLALCPAFPSVEG
jgi:hypothetical protein